MRARDPTRRPLARAALRALGVAVLLLAGAPAVSAPGPYRLIDLGPVAPGPLGLNDAGQAVGTRVDATGRSRGFLYTPGQGHVDLGTLGGPWATAQAINRWGQVTGGSVDAAGIGQAYVWTPGEGMVAIPPAPGGAAGHGINDQGQVAGVFHVFGEVSVPFLYTPGQGAIALGGFSGTYGSASAVNRLGQVTGVSEDLTLNPAAFLWTPDAGLARLHPEGTGGTGQAINDRGQVTGTFASPSDVHPGSVAFLHTPGRGSSALGVLPGHVTSVGLGLNERGDVVGQSSSAAHGPQAFLWTAERGLQSLQALLEPGNAVGWTLDQAWDVNEAGQIVGTGRRGDQARGFLLTPVPEPGSFVLLGLGVAVLALARRRPGRPRRHARGPATASAS